MRHILQNTVPIKKKRVAALGMSIDHCCASLSTCRPRIVHAVANRKHEPHSSLKAKRFIQGEKNIGHKEQSTSIIV